MRNVVFVAVVKSHSLCDARLILCLHAFLLQLTFIHPVKEDEISSRKRHPQTPPDEADTQGIASCCSVEDGDVKLRTVTGGKQSRIEGCSHSCQRRDDICTRCHKGRQFPAAAIPFPRENECHHDHRREYEEHRIL